MTEDLGLMPASELLAKSLNFLDSSFIALKCKPHHVCISLGCSELR